MLAKDSIAAPLAECYVTINGNRYNFMQAINLEANIEKTKTEVNMDEIIINDNMIKK